METKAQLEERVLRIADDAEKGLPIEDSLVEIKSAWPPPDGARRGALRLAQTHPLESLSSGSSASMRTNGRSPVPTMRSLRNGGLKSRSISTTASHQT